MSKRGAEEQGGQERYGGAGFGGGGNAGANDPPKQATAAQLARRKIATGKTPRRANNISRSTSPSKTTPSNFNQNQSMGFTPGATGFNFGSSTTADGSQSNMFSTNAFSQQPPPVFGQGNGVTGVNAGGAALSQPTSNSLPPPASAPSTTSVLDAFRKSQEANGIAYGVKGYSGPSGNSPFKHGSPPAPAASKNQAVGGSGFANFLNSQAAKGISYEKKKTGQEDYNPSFPDETYNAKDLDGNHIKISAQELGTGYWQKPGQDSSGSEYIFIINNRDTSQQPVGRDHLLVHKDPEKNTSQAADKMPPNNQQPPGTGLFGSSAPPPGAGLFGSSASPPGTGLFGSSTSTPPPTTNGQSVFANLNNTGPKPTIDFRNMQSTSSTQPPGSGLFGSSTPSSFTNGGNSFGGGFGQNQQNNTNTSFGGGFGQNQQNQGTNGSFGQTQQNNSNNGGFGQTQQNNGNNGGFGQTQNQSNSQQSFGSSNFGSFGNNNNQAQQGSGSSQPSSFGSQQAGKANTGFNFGQSNNTQGFSSNGSGTFGQPSNTQQEPVNPKAGKSLEDRMTPRHNNEPVHPNAGKSLEDRITRTNDQPAVKTGVLGAASSTSTTGLFGSPSPSAGSHTQNPFAALPSVTTGPIDRRPSSPFAQVTQKSSFGMPSNLPTSPTASTMPTSGFGAPSAPYKPAMPTSPYPPGTSAFGKPSSPSPTSTAPPSFGKPSSPSPTSTAPPSSMFGAASSKTNTGGFGKPSSPSTASSAPSNDMFGGAAANVSKGMFGQPSPPTSTAPPKDASGASLFAKPAASSSQPAKESEGEKEPANDANDKGISFLDRISYTDPNKKEHVWADGSTTPMSNSASPPAATVDDNSVAQPTVDTYQPPKPKPFVDPLDRSDFVTDSPSAAAKSSSAEASSYTMSGAIPAPTQTAPPVTAPQSNSFMPPSFTPAAPSEPARPQSYKPTPANALVPTATPSGGLNRLARFNQGAIAHLLTQDPSQDLTQLWLFYAEAAKKIKAGIEVPSAPAGLSGGSEGSKSSDAPAPQLPKPAPSKNIFGSQTQTSSTTPKGISFTKSQEEVGTPQIGSRTNMFAQAASPETPSWIDRMRNQKAGAPTEVESAVASTTNKPETAPKSSGFGSTSKLGGFSFGSSDPFISKTPAPAKTTIFGSPMPQPPATAPASKKRSANDDLTRDDAENTESATNKRRRASGENEQPSTLTPASLNDGFAKPPATAPVSKKRSVEEDDATEPSNGKRRRSSGQNDSTKSAFGIFTKALGAPTSSPSPEPEPASNSQLSKLNFKPAFKQSAFAPAKKSPLSESMVPQQTPPKNSASARQTSEFNGRTPSASELAKEQKMVQAAGWSEFAKEGVSEEDYLIALTSCAQSISCRKPGPADFRRRQMGVRAAMWELIDESKASRIGLADLDDDDPARQKDREHCAKMKKRMEWLSPKIDKLAAGKELSDEDRSESEDEDDVDCPPGGYGPPRMPAPPVTRVNASDAPKAALPAFKPTNQASGFSPVKSAFTAGFKPSAESSGFMPTNSTPSAGGFKPSTSTSAFNPASATPKAFGGFKPSTSATSFTPASAIPNASGGFMNAFGDQAKKAEEAAKKRRMDEDYDSDEETKEQWEKRDAEKQAKLKEEMNKAAPPTGFKFSGAATPSAPSAFKPAAATSGFKPSSAAPKASGSFLNAFGDQAKKAEDAAKQRRMDEDYDSEEESKEEWEKRDTEKQAKLKAEMSKAAPATGFKFAAPAPSTSSVPTTSASTTTSAPTSFTPFTSAVPKTSAPTSFTPFMSTTPKAPTTTSASTTFGQPSTLTSSFGAAATKTPSQDKRKRSRDADEEDEDAQARQETQKKVKSVDTPKNNIFDRGMNDNNFAADGSGPVIEKPSTDNDEDAAPAEKQVEDLTDLTKEEQAENEVLVDLPVAKASMMETGKGWKEHGKGRTFVLMSKATGKVRMLMKTKPMGRAVMNFAVLPGHPEMYEVVGAKRASVKATLVLHGEGGAGKPVPFFLQCKTTTDAESVVAGLLRGCSQ